MTTLSLPTLEDFTSGHIKSLGWEILDWGTAMLGQPDGDFKGEPWIYSPEQALFLLRFYAVGGDGRFIFRRAVLERPKGWGKARCSPPSVAPSASVPPDSTAGTLTASP